MVELIIIEEEAKESIVETQIFCAIRSYYL